MTRDALSLAVRHRLHENGWMDPVHGLHAAFSPTVEGCTCASCRDRQHVIALKGPMLNIIKRAMAKPIYGDNFRRLEPAQRRALAWAANAVFEALDSSRLLT